MRIFPIIAAIAVSFLMYMAIFQRDALMAAVGIGQSDEATESLTADPAPNQVADQGLVKVVVQRSTATSLESAVIVRGQTAAARQVDVQAETSATVASPPLRKGSRVAAGDTLCELDIGTRDAAQKEAQARRAEAASRVPESESRVVEAQARLDEAMIRFNAATKLGEDGFSSTAQIATAGAAVAAARAGVSSAEAGLNAAKSGIEAADAAVAVTQTEIDRLTLTAPFAGLLESDTAELGSLLQKGSICARVIQLDPIKLVGFVPETEVDRVTLGAPAAARLAAGNRQINGQVTFISRASDPSTRTFRVEIDVPNPDLSIRDGQTAEIAIASAGVNAHLIPQSSMTLDDDGILGVRTIDENNVVAFNPVELVRDTPQGIWVVGLPETVTIIVLGQEYVTAGVTVAPTLREVTQ
ncbi:efflux RND transporter periplasmic adaptor subunit [Sulfitobacter sp.]|uniref:efflux RND transporter periplasmic adaptor subunit n=1 Tax=Sulfitobacter sp. TaxID=1903071 RepID=UPI003F6B1F26